MFLTKECDYAIRVVRALSGMEKKTVKEICDLEHVPFNFAYKILKKLERAGIVQSIRGAHGGYQLSKALNKISLFDIISAADTELYINECLKPGHECINNMNGKLCSVHQELGQIQANLTDILKAKTFDMLK